MSNQRPSRTRAVRLTDDALQAFRDALQVRWQEDPSRGRLTREARAELLGVSIATAERILAQRGVDRSTLVLAHQNLRIPWRDDLCEPVPKDVVTPDVESIPAAVPLPRNSAPVAVPARHPHRRRLHMAVSLLALALAVLVFKSPTRPDKKAPVDPNWVTEFNRAFDDGMSEYHRANYPLAQRHLQRASAIAKEHESVGKLSSVFRLSGDLAAATGSLSTARSQYVLALNLRTALDQDASRPPIWEALGDVQVRLGEYAPARQSLLNALEGYRAQRLPVGVAMACRGLGSLAYQTGDLRSADDWFRASIKSVNGCDKPDIEMDVLARQALIKEKRGLHAEARAMLARCLEYWKQKNHPRWIATTQLQLASTELHAGNTEVGLALLSDCKAQFDRLGDRVGSLEAQSKLKRFLKRNRIQRS